MISPSLNSLGYRTDASEVAASSDLVEITATEYRFRGRYIDDEGKVVWGTESEELNTLVQQ